MESTAVVRALAALAQPARLEIYRRVMCAGPGGMPAGRIAEACGIAPATLSFHLAQLRHAGLVSQRRQGRSLIYAAEIATMNALVMHLTETCCGGNPELCKPSTSSQRTTSWPSTPPSTPSSSAPGTRRAASSRNR